MILAGALLVVVSAISILLSRLSRRKFNPPLFEEQPKDDSRHQLRLQSIPFLVIHDLSWTELDKALQHFHTLTMACLNGLSASMDVARTTEEKLFGESRDGRLFSDHVLQRIERLATIFQQDEELLERMLRPIPVQKMLPSITNHRQFRSQSDTITRMINSSEDNERRFQRSQNKDKSRNREPTEDRNNTSPSSYASGVQVLGHLVRDWTHLGRDVREHYYDWCRHQLSSSRHHPSQHRRKILVPGAGLGRLAYDLAMMGYSVEANEISVVMCSAAHFILNPSNVNSSYVVHPFATDYFTNEVTDDHRYQAIRFPVGLDTHQFQNRGGSLSYLMSDFSWYAQTLTAYDAIVTCFFIDTATNLYEYMAIISNALVNGGIWINVGPLQWHSNALLHPSASQVKEMIQSLGFVVSHWSVDTQAMDYRLGNSFATGMPSTKLEAFRPIRWVAWKHTDKIFNV